MDRRYDPRSIVTPYAFAVHPDLVGRPLATPWQRLGAILVDVAVIFFLSDAVPGVLLALASAVLLFWLAIRKPGRDVFGKLFRVFVGCLGAFVLFVTLGILLLVRYGPELRKLGTQAVEEIAQEAGVPLDSLTSTQEGAGLRQVMGVVQEAAAFRGVDSPAGAEEVATRLARNAQELGIPRDQISAFLLDLMPEDAAWYGEADAIIERALMDLPVTSESQSPGSGQTPPTAPVEGPGEELGAITDSLALDSIRVLGQELQQERDAREEAEARARTAQQSLEKAQNAGPLAWLYDLIDELGLGFGWGALYLTVTHAWWRGTSVGKRLFRIRVVMIDRRPLNWWLSFERAGGYAAGFATGLLGFAQVFWDPNRQAIHDKVAETIVIQEGKAPVPGPWMEEAQALWAGRRGEAGDFPAEGKKNRKGP